MYKLVNAKNGHNGTRGTSFVGNVANTYNVVDENGNVVGGFDFLNVIHPVSGMRCKMWTGVIEGIERIAPMTYLSEVREFVKSL